MKRNLISINESTISTKQINNYWLHLSTFYKILTGKVCRLSFELEFSLEDWIFKPRGENVLVFNSALVNKCTSDYYLSILIHELYHYVEHKISRKSEVKILKDFYGDGFMRIMDIEADLYTAKYFHEIKRIDYQDFLRILYNGRNVFSDPKVRAGKLARFLGTLLSIGHYFKTNIPKIFLPELRDIAINGITHLIVVKKGAHQHIKIEMDNNHLRLLKDLYQTPQISFKEYIQGVNKIVDYTLGVYMLETNTG